MKRYNALLAISMLVLLPGLPASAQQAVAKTTPFASPMTALDELKIDSLILDGADAKTALLTLLKQTTFNYDFARDLYQVVYRQADGVTKAVPPEGDSLNLPPVKVTVRLRNVRFSTALKSLTNSIGIRWTAEGDDKNVTIHFLPGEPQFGEHGVVGQTPVLGQTIKQGFASVPSGYVLSALLPQVRVKLDNHDTSVRDSLKSIMESAKIDFAIDEDIPGDLKRSFTFDNVTLATALALICESSDIGWRVEQLSSGVLVRVSKRYAPAPPVANPPVSAPAVP